MKLFNNQYSLNGKINFSEFTEIKTNIVSPNIMGFFAYLPYMECYHGIVSMNHNINGYFELNKKILDFSEGKGYIEKDWGISFPKEYIWIQSNHFKDSATSIMCSIANIPFLGTSFQGFICNLHIEGKEYRFATYNHSKLLKVDYSENHIDIIIEKGNLVLKLNAKMFGGGTLKAPKNGNMKQLIKEGLDGVVEVKLINKLEEEIFIGEGSACGIELVNDRNGKK